LGSGNYGTVKSATDPAGKEVALKVFDISTPENYATSLEQLRAEVEGYDNLSHPNIVRFLTSQESGVKVRSNGEKVPVAYIALEFV
jgi:serine/threonine protein kinase